MQWVLEVENIKIKEFNTALNSIENHAWKTF